MLYALAGVVDERRAGGPGRHLPAAWTRSSGEGETWFRLGDLDLATHLRRTELLAGGRAPSEVTAELARGLGLSGLVVLPMTD